MILILGNRNSKQDFSTKIMKLKILFITYALLFCSCNSFFKKGISKKEAIGIAEKVWLEKYGESINDNRPFVVHNIEDSLWHVNGTLPPDEVEIIGTDTIITITLGGVPHIDILKSSGDVLKVYHTK